MKLTVRDIFLALKRGILLIICVSLVGVIIFGVATLLFVDKEYTATAKLYVYNEKSDNNHITSSDLTVSKSLVETYLIIVKSSPVLEAVSKELRSTYPDISPKMLDELIDGAAINDTETFYISVKHENRQMATDIVNKVIEIAPEYIIQVVKAASVEIIEDARLPETDDYDWPIIQNMIIGFGVGFVLAVVYIITTIYLDTTVYGRREITSNFKFPIIGSIPTLNIEGQIRKKKFLKKQSVTERNGIRCNFILNDSTEFAVAEAYRMARTNIFYLPIESKCKKIAITSAVASEGKSYTSINIAKVLAQAGKKVLLIDADMRSPRVARYTGMSQKNEGLSEFLAGITTEINIIKDTPIGVDVLLSGKSSTSAAELLAMGAVDKLFEKVSAEYDYVIIDTPPTNVVTDSTVLAEKVDGYIISARAGFSNIDELKQMTRALELLNAKILGMVISNVDPKTEQGVRYGRYYKKYSYRRYYGYGERHYSDKNSNYGDANDITDGDSNPQ